MPSEPMFHMLHRGSSGGLSMPYIPKGARGQRQGLSQDLETGCLKLAIVKSLGAKFIKGTTIYSDFNHKSA